MSLIFFIGVAEPDELQVRSKKEIHECLLSPFGNVEVITILSLAEKGVCVSFILSRDKDLADYIASVLSSDQKNLTDFLFSRRRSFRRFQKRSITRANLNDSASESSQ